MSTLLFLVEFLEKGHEICHFWAILQVGTDTQIGVVPLPLNKTKVVPVPTCRTKVVPVLRQSGIGTNLQNRVGTGTEQCGTGTNASSSPDNCVLTSLSLNSYTDGIGTLIND